MLKTQTVTTHHHCNKNKQQAEVTACKTKHDKQTYAHLYKRTSSAIKMLKVKVFIKSSSNLIVSSQPLLILYWYGILEFNIPLDTV